MNGKKYIVFNNLAEEFIVCDTLEEMVETVSDCYILGGTPFIYKEV